MVLSGESVPNWDEGLNRRRKIGKYIMSSACKERAFDVNLAAVIDSLKINTYRRDLSLGKLYRFRYFSIVVISTGNVENINVIRHIKI